MISCSWKESPVGRGWFLRIKALSSMIWNSISVFGCLNLTRNAPSLSSLPTDHSSWWTIGWHRMWAYLSRSCPSTAKYPRTEWKSGWRLSPSMMLTSTLIILLFVSHAQRLQLKFIPIPYWDGQSTNLTLQQSYGGWKNSKATWSARYNAMFCWAAVWNKTHGWNLQ